MRRSDKIQFDTAKERVQRSKLDDHSKEGISVALELAGEACNGMEENKKMEALTQAVFAMTLSVSYFMSQAPDQLDKSVNTAVERHVETCAKLAQRREKQPRERAGSVLSFSFTEGIKAKGMAAIVIGAVLAVVLSLYGLARWQDSKTRVLLNDMFDKKIEQMTDLTTLSQTTKRGDTQ